MTTLPVKEEEHRAYPPVNSVNSDGIGHPHRVTCSREHGVSLMALRGMYGPPVPAETSTQNMQQSGQRSVLPIGRDL